MTIEPDARPLAPIRSRAPHRRNPARRGPPGLPRRRLRPRPASRPHPARLRRRHLRHAGHRPQALPTHLRRRRAFGVVLVADETLDETRLSKTRPTRPRAIPSPRSPPSAPTASIPTAAIPTMFTTPPIPPKTSSAATSPSTACCSIPHSLGLIENLETPAVRAGLLDYVNGLADLDAGIIRAIGDPHRRFDEDQLRLLRAVRFAARFGLHHRPNTLAAIRHLAATHPRRQPRARPRRADQNAHRGPRPPRLRAFGRNRSPRQVLPEIASMKGVSSLRNSIPKATSAFTRCSCSSNSTPRSVHARLGRAPPRRRQAPNLPPRADRIRFDGHVEVGVAMAAEICRRFRFSNEETAPDPRPRRKPHALRRRPRMKASTLKRFFRLPSFEEHLALHRMDCLAAQRQPRPLQLRQRAHHSIAEHFAQPAPYRPRADRRRLHTRRRFKEILHAAEEAQLEGAIHTRRNTRLVRAQFPIPAKLKADGSQLILSTTNCEL